MDYKPHAKQLAVHNSKQKRIILNWGRQTGKTVLAVNYTWIEAIKRQGRYFIVFPTYQQAYDALWSQYIGFIPKEIINKVDQQRLTITLHYLDADITLPTGEKVKIQHDPDKPPSTIELKGSDTETADRLRGAKVSGFVFDEYAYHDPEKWENVFEPMMATTDGWAMFISSPEGFNHFWDMWEYAQKRPKDWFALHATAYDNPDVPKSFLKKKKRELLDMGKENTWYQQYMAEFRQMEGLVYKDFHRDLSVFNEFGKMPSSGTRVAGIDFGFTNPTAVVFFLIDYDGNWWLYDEIYEKERTMDEIANIIKQKMAGDKILWFAADSAQPEHIATLGKYGVPVVPVVKTRDAITRGIDLCRELVKPRVQLEGDPKPKLFIHSSCVNFIKEIQSYRYPPTNKHAGMNRNDKEEPLKEDDHLMDAWRYARLVQQDKPNHRFDFPEDNLFDEEGFRL